MVKHSKCQKTKLYVVVVYQVCLNCWLLDFFLWVKFLFHLTWGFAYSFIHPPKTPIFLLAAISIATLFWLPCLNPFFHTSPHQRKMALLGFGLEWIEITKFAPMIVFSQKVTCKNRWTLFYVNILTHNLILPQLLNNNTFTYHQIHH